MSKSLSLEYEPIDQPAAKDPVERITWCALKIRIGDRFVTQVFDKTTRLPRTALYVPAFPIAEWIATNWWFLWSEGQRTSDPWEWRRRHCLRAADSALLIPSLTLFNDGKSQRAKWDSDPDGSLPHMPAEFVSSGDEVLDIAQSRRALIEFVDDTLGRVRNLDDPRVSDLRSLWKAIRSADKEEEDFCTLSGRLGVDPYDRDEMTDDLASFLETEFKDFDSPLVTDLVDVAQPDTLRDQWQWILRTNKELSIGPYRSDPSFSFPSRSVSPPQFGYELARQSRSIADRSDEQKIDTVEKLADPILKKTFRVEDRNHLPGNGIQSLIGQTAPSELISVGPRANHEHSRRFLTSRSLYHAITNTRSSQRLVTEANSWDQQASRAFAAELLIPQQAIRNRIYRSVADQPIIDELSNDYCVSTHVIELQLKNMKISIAND